MNVSDRLVDPHWQAAVAIPVALLLIATGAITTRGAADESATLAPAVGFLVAVLVLADACRSAGLFAAVADRLAHYAGDSPSRLLASTFLLASAATVALSLDTTVVLVTPVVVDSANSREIDPAPGAYATAHLANSASLLLPFSNLTNLLAVVAVGPAFGRFAGLMLGPWLVVIAVEWIVIRRWFRVPRSRTHPSPRQCVAAVPRVTACVVGVTLAGLVAASAAGVPVAWIAGAGALVLGGFEVAAGRASVRSLVQAGQLPFAAFVLALGVIVRAAGSHGIESGLGRVINDGHSLGGLLVIAGVSAAVANVVNNLPATLLLIPVVAGLGSGAILAMLIGVDVGPNLSYLGSLATLLWRRQVGEIASARRFSLLGAVTVPIQLVLATAVLWLTLRLT